MHDFNRDQPLAYYSQKKTNYLHITRYLLLVIMHIVHYKLVSKSNQPTTTSDMSETPISSGVVQP